MSPTPLVIVVIRNIHKVVCIVNRVAYRKHHFIYGRCICNWIYNFWTSVSIWKILFVFLFLFLQAVILLMLKGKKVVGLPVSHPHQRFVYCCYLTSAYIHLRLSISSGEFYSLIANTMQVHSFFYGFICDDWCKVWFSFRLQLLILLNWASPTSQDMNE